MKTYQTILLVLLVIRFLFNLYHDFNGRTGHKPFGFIGGTISIGSFLLYSWLYWKSGALSTFTE